MVVMEIGGCNRSELWWKIFNFVNSIPRKECVGDAPDVCSVTTELEKLFNLEHAKI